MFHRWVVHAYFMSNWNPQFCCISIAYYFKNSTSVCWVLAHMRRMCCLFYIFHLDGHYTCPWPFAVLTSIRASATLRRAISPLFLRHVTQQYATWTGRRDQQNWAWQFRKIGHRLNCQNTNGSETRWKPFFLVFVQVFVVILVCYCCFFSRFLYFVSFLVIIICSISFSIFLSLSLFLVVLSLSLGLSLALSLSLFPPPRSSYFSCWLTFFVLSPFLFLSVSCFIVFCSVSLLLSLSLASFSSLFLFPTRRAFSNDTSGR